MNSKDRVRALLSIEVELPIDFNESEIDEAISDLICDNFDGEVIESKEYKIIEDEDDFDEEW